MNPKVDILLTLSPLYREKLPDLPAALAGHWRRVTRDIIGPETQLEYTIAHTQAEFTAAVRGAEAHGADRLVVLPMAYAPSGAATALVTTHLPLIIVSSARDYALPTDMDGSHIMANQSMHGAIDLCNYLNRRGRAYHLVTGHPDQAGFRARLRALVNTQPLPAVAGPLPPTTPPVPASCKALPGLSRAVKVLKHGRVGRIGDPFEGMMDLTFDVAAQQAALGFEIIPVTAGTLVDRARHCAGDGVTDFLASLAGFSMDPGLNSAELEASARMALALESVVKDLQLDAIAINFMPLIEAGAATLPFLGASRLLTRGIGYAGEADVLTAALSAALYHLTPETTFTELYSPDYRRNELFLSHMGECNYALASDADPVRLKAKPFNWGKCLRPAVPVFRMKPGTVTVVSLSEAIGADAFQLVTFSASVTACEEHPNLTVPYTRVHFDRSIGDFLGDYTRQGGTHHAVLIYGHNTADAITALAEACGLRCCIIETGSPGTAPSSPPEP